MAHDGQSTVIESRCGRYKDLYTGIAHALRTGNAPPVPAEPALNVSVILEAALHSSAERCTVP